MTTTHRPITRSAARFLTTGIALAALIGCSSNEPKFDTFPADTSAAPTLPPATQPPTTTAAPVTTTAPAETTQAPIDTTAPPVPTTTLEQSVEEGFRTARATLAACGVSPTNCNPDAYAVPASPEHDRLVKLMEERVREGLVAAEGSGTRYDVIESIEVGADLTSATVSYCYVDGRWLMVSNGTLDDLSDDILIDDSLTSLRVEQALKLTPAGWRVTETTVLEKWAGENKCGPEQ